MMGWGLHSRWGTRHRGFPATDNTLALSISASFHILVRTRWGGKQWECPEPQQKGLDSSSPSLPDSHLNYDSVLHCVS